VIGMMDKVFKIIDDIDYFEGDKNE